MADVAAELLLLFPDEEEEDEEEEIDPQEIPSPYWYNEDERDFFDTCYESDIFDPEFSVSSRPDLPFGEPILIDEDVRRDDIEEDRGDGDGGNHIERRQRRPHDSDSDSNLGDQVSLVLNLLQEDFRTNPFAETVEDREFGVFDSNEDMVSNHLEMGLGLGLGLGFDDENENNRVELMDSVSDPGESSGLRIVGFESDSDEEEEERMTEIDLNPIFTEHDAASGRIAEELGIPLCWDCLRLEDQREPNEDFEWEEVDSGIVEERDALSMVIDVDEDDDQSVPSDLRSVHEIHNNLEDEVETLRNLEWEVLIAVNNLERNASEEHDAETYLGDDGYVYTAEYEMLFGQFAENENPLKGSPPAAKSVVESLPMVLLTQEDVEKGNAICAVCKDDIAIEERAKRLPCSHHYHGDCILPWLHIRNTCPVCRYELLTDDPDYEQWKAQRGSQGNSRESRVWYDFEMFPDH
eukprot:TRINITY_DN961_c1_g2_i1.p1 TRINITY_DN961_c1_g2~~TRINITY_DN961_c1_g2_i1.p1  ORF type:complete len:474 (-),score=90.10 TRINITY_DN961_c1_g2_i1:180-1574(-)